VDSGQWTPFTFRPDFDKRPMTNPTQYKKHSVPTGATTPVPADAEGKRSHSGWEFHYKGWTGDGNVHRSGASHDNMFPDSRKGSLDADVLRKLGLTKKRMDEKDALFFFQSILHICKPGNSGIDGDPRRSFYSEAETFSNLYALEPALGRLCGDLTELIKHTQSKKSVKLPKICVVCGIDSYCYCTACGKAVHAPFSKNGELCFFDLHDDSFFGLGRDDCNLAQKRKAEWIYSTPTKRRENTKHIQNLLKDHIEEDD
jgi:hypothetical protein